MANPGRRELLAPWTKHWGYMRTTHPATSHRSSCTAERFWESQQTLPGLLRSSTGLQMREGSSVARRDWNQRTWGWNLERTFRPPLLAVGLRVGLRCSLLADVS